MMLNLLLSIVLACLIHEAGHYVAARHYRHSIKYHFGWGYIWKVPVPRFVWYMPEDTEAHRQIMAIAGFGAELLAAPFLYYLGLTLYPYVAIAHLLLYPLYAGTANDFRWFPNGALGISTRGWTWIYVMVMCAAFWYGIYRLLMFIW